MREKISGRKPIRTKCHPQSQMGIFFPSARGRQGWSLGKSEEFHVDTRRRRECFAEPRSPEDKWLDRSRSPEPQLAQGEFSGSDIKSLKCAEVAGVRI